METEYNHTYVDCPQPSTRSHCRNHPDSPLFLFIEVADCQTLANIANYGLNYKTNVIKTCE